MQRAVQEIANIYKIQIKFKIPLLYFQILCVYFLPFFPLLLSYPSFCGRVAEIDS